jgi:hypothetical protein
MTGQPKHEQARENMMVDAIDAVFRLTQQTTRLCVALVEATAIIDWGASRRLWAGESEGTKEYHRDVAQARLVAEGLLPPDH